MEKKINKKTIENRVKELLSERLDLAHNEIDPGKRIIEDFGIDSFWALELIFEIEDNFRITVPENDRAEIRTLKDIVNYIFSRINRKSQKGKLTYECSSKK